MQEALMIVQILSLVVSFMEAFKEILAYVQRRKYAIEDFEEKGVAKKEIREEKRFSREIAIDLLKKKFGMKGREARMVVEIAVNLVDLFDKLNIQVPFSKVTKENWSMKPEDLEKLGLESSE